MSKMSATSSRRRKCCRGCESDGPVYKFPSEGDPRRIDWVRLLRPQKPCNKYLFACYRHFSPRMKLNTRLTHWAIPNMHLPTEIPATAEELRIGNTCSRITRENKLLDEGISNMEAQIVEFNSERKQLKQEIKDLQSRTINNVFIIAENSGNQFPGDLVVRVRESVQKKYPQPTDYYVFTLKK